MVNVWRHGAMLNIGQQMAPYLVMSNKDETELLQKTMRGPSHTKVSWTWAIMLRNLSDVTNIMSIQNTLARPSGWTPPLPHFIDVEVWLFCCSNKLLSFFFIQKPQKTQSDSEKNVKETTKVTQRAVTEIICCLRLRSLCHRDTKLLHLWCRERESF